MYTKSRSSVILPAMVNARVHVHDGQRYVPLVVQEEFVGKRLGQLVRKPWMWRVESGWNVEGVLCEIVKL